MDGMSVPIGCKEIPGFQGYCISWEGEVFSRRKSAWRKLNGHVSNSTGYIEVSLLNRGNGRKRRFTNKNIHRLMGEVFLGCKFPGLQVCHNDGVKTNNHLSNLRLDTTKGNANDRIKHGTERFGKKNHATVLTEDQVREIRRLVATGLSSGKLGMMFGVDKSTIKDIRSKRSWAWLS